jgi:hypothetical protein
MNETGAGRERLPYRLNAVVGAVRGLTRETDARLEEVITDVVAAIEDDGVIDEAESRGVLIGLTRAFRSNASALNVLNLLDESGSEAALRETERIEAKRRPRGGL